MAPGFIGETRSSSGRSGTSRSRRESSRRRSNSSNKASRWPAKPVSTGGSGACTSCSARRCSSWAVWTKRSGKRASRSRLRTFSATGAAGSGGSCCWPGSRPCGAMRHAPEGSGERRRSRKRSARAGSGYTSATSTRSGSSSWTVQSFSRARRARAQAHARAGGRGGAGGLAEWRRAAAGAEGANSLGRRHCGGKGEQRGAEGSEDEQRDRERVGVARARACRSSGGMRTGPACRSWARRPARKSRLRCCRCCRCFRAGAAADVLRAARAARGDLGLQRGGDVVRGAGVVAQVLAHVADRVAIAVERVRADRAAVRPVVREPSSSKASRPPPRPAGGPGATLPRGRREIAMKAAGRFRIRLVEQSGLRAQSDPCGVIGS